MNGNPTFSSCLPPLKKTDSQASLRIDSNTQLKKFSSRNVSNQTTQQQVTKNADIHYVPTAYKRHEETEKELRLIGNLQHASSFKSFKSESIPLLTYTLGPSEGVTKLNDMLRSRQSSSSSGGNGGVVTRQFSCGKYQPNKTCKKDFYLPTGGDGKEWTRKIFDILRTEQSSMKFNVLLTYSNEVLVQFTIDLYLFSRQKYEELNAYMNSLVLHGLGSELILRKRGDRWGRLESINEEAVTAGVESHKENNQSTSSSSSSLPHNITLENTNDNNSSLVSIDTRKRESMNKSSADHSNGGNNNNNNINDIDGDTRSIPLQPQQQPQKLMYLCYSMYTPWVSDAASSVHKAAGQFDRQKARHVRAAVIQHRAQFN